MDVGRVIDRPPLRGRDRSWIDRSPLRGRDRSEIADSAVSPVIGMVLVLAIAVLGITVVVMWGFPAIADLRSSKNFRGVLEQFHDLEANFQDVSTGSAGQTGVRWYPRADEGVVWVNATGERWLVAANFTPPGMQGPFSFHYGDLGNDDSMIRINNTGAALDSGRIRAFSVASGIRTEIRAYLSSTICSGSLGSSPAFAWGSGVAQDFTLCTNDSAPLLVSLPATFIEIVIANGANVTVLEKAWIANLGEVGFSTSAGLSPREVRTSNGALFSGRPGDLTLQGDPSVSPPRSFTNVSGATSTSMFFRFSRVIGSESFGLSGTGASPEGLLVSLVRTTRIADETNVTAVKFYDVGGLSAAWYGALVDSAVGYRFARETATVAGEPTEYLVHREGAVAFRFGLTDTLFEVSR